MTNESLTVVTVRVMRQDIEGQTVDKTLEIALRRVVDAGYAITVGITRSYLGMMATIELPVFVQDMLVRGFILKPFTFTLSLPTAALRDSAIPAQETPDATPKN